MDEIDPDERELALDIYDPSCPNKPPFGADFVAAFRAAQIARNRRITDWALDLARTLKHRNTRRDGARLSSFIAPMCDVRWIDATIDPNGRKPNWCYPRRSAHRQFGAGRPCALLVVAFVAVAMVLRQVERQGASERRARAAKRRCCRSSIRPTMPCRRRIIPTIRAALGDEGQGVRRDRRVRRTTTRASPSSSPNASRRSPTGAAGKGLLA